MFRTEEDCALELGEIMKDHDKHMKFLHQTRLKAKYGDAYLLEGET